jgi:hypothetical protein
MTSDVMKRDPVDVASTGASSLRLRGDLDVAGAAALIARAVGLARDGARSIVCDLVKHVQRSFALSGRARKFCWGGQAASGGSSVGFW